VDLRSIRREVVPAKPWPAAKEDMIVDIGFDLGKAAQRAVSCAMRRRGLLTSGIRCVGAPTVWPSAVPIVLAHMSRTDVPAASVSKVREFV
jgi:hypothetical protein